MSRWPLVNTDHLYFKTIPRGYGALSAEIMVNGVKIQLMNVHLDRDDHVQSKNGSVEFNPMSAWRFLKDEMLMDTVRSRSAHALIKWLEQKRAEHIIVGGDFNTIPLSRSIRIMGTMLNDVLWPSWNFFQGTYTRLNAPFPVRIDFLFHTSTLSCLEAGIIRKSPGDHYPVMARFTLPESARTSP